MADDDDIHKSPTLTPGTRMVPINPGMGAMRGRHPGDVSGRPRKNPLDSLSAYAREDWPQPPNTISDVDIDANWFSPFQPVTPFGPPYQTWPRTYDYPVGENLQYVTPRFQLFEVLRAVAQSWGLLQTVIQTRIDQLIRMPWTIRPVDKPDEENRRTKEVMRFLECPDGQEDFETWARMVLYDLLVIDAPAVYVRKDRGGKPMEWWCLDGGTIKPLIDDAGRRPSYPQPAFQQIIKGLPNVNFDEAEILYCRQRPRPSLPIFGYSPVEQIVMEIMEGLKKQAYKVSFWTEGSMPEMIMSVPESWRPDQIAAFQAFFDGMLSGNLQLKSKVRFVPSGMTPFSVKNANGEGLHNEEDEWLARIVCYAFSVSAQPFIRQMNRATAQTAQEEAAQEGLHPLMNWFSKRLMKPLIQNPRYGFGYKDIEFAFEQEKQTDEVKQMTKLTGYVKAGIMTVNESRKEIDLNPDPAGDELVVETANGPTPLAETVEANRARANAVPDQIQQQKEAHDQQMGAGEQQMGLQESGEERAQEAHDVQVQQSKQEMKQQKKGVGKLAGSPFGKGPRRREIALTHDLAKEAEAARRISELLKHAGASISAQYRAGAILKARKPIVIDLEEVGAALGLDDFTLEAVTDATLRIDRDAKITDQINQRAVEFAQKQAARLVVGINKTTRDALRELIAEGLAAGKSRDEIADDIAADFSFSDERAQRIASYEINTAFNGAALIGAQEAAAAGANVQKRWIDALGACDVCQENAAAGPIDLDEDFPSGDSAPSAHPRCRCSLAFVVSEDDLGRVAKGEKVLQPSLMTKAGPSDEPRDARGRWISGATVYRGGGSGEFSTAWHGKGVYVSADQAAASQWGIASAFTLHRKPNLLDLENWNGPAKALVAGKEGVKQRDLDRKTYEAGAVEAFIQMNDETIGWLKHHGFDGARLGDDAFLIGPLSRHATKLTMTKAGPADEPRDAHGRWTGVLTGKPDLVVTHWHGVNNQRVYTVTDKQGKWVAEARLSPTGKWMATINVEPEYRRQGIASAIYNLIEADLGHPLEPNPLSESGRAFWASRKFAKQAKITQAAASYVDAAPSNEYCNDCVMFRASGTRLLSSCTLVEGDIHPGGWCRHWEKGDVSVQTE